MMRAIRSKLKNLDFLSSHAKIYGDGNSSVLQSTFGGLISSLTLLFIFMISGYFSLQFLSIEKPFVIQNSEYRNDSILYNFSSFPFLFRISDEYGYNLPDEERIMSPGMLWCKSMHDKDNKVVQVYENMSIRRCNDTHIAKFPSVLTEQITDLKSYFCTDWPSQNYTLNGLYGGADNYTFTYIKLRHCVNNINGQNCLPNEEIDLRLRNIYLDTIFFDNQIMPTSITPNKLIISSDRYRISNTFFRKISIFLSQVDVITDIGLVFVELQLSNFFQIEKSEMSISTLSKEDLYNGYTFLAITVSNYKYKNFYYRSYLKLQDMLSNIGGIIEIVYILGTVICNILGWNIADMYCADGYPIYYAYDLDNSSDKLLFSQISKIRMNQEGIEMLHEVRSQMKNQNNSNISPNPLVLPIKNFDSSLNSVVAQAKCNNFIKNMSIKDNEVITKRRDDYNLKLKISEKLLPFRCTSSKGTRDLFRLRGRIFEKIRTLNYKNLIFKLSELDYLKSYIFNEDQLEVFNFLHCTNNKLLGGVIENTPSNLKQSLIRVHEFQEENPINKTLSRNFLKVQQ